MAGQAGGRASRFTVLVVVSLLGLGCAATAKLRGQVAITKKELEQIEKNGAYVCAPKELALAKAHLKFAELEIFQGRKTDHDL